MNRRALLGPLLLSAVVAAGCGSSSSNQPASTSSPQTSNASPNAATSSSQAASTGQLCSGGAIAIGIAKGKTGNFALFDAAGARGSLIAADQINAEGGVDGCKLKMTWQDTQSNPGTGAQVAQSLISQGAKILVLASSPDLALPSALIAKKANVFAISPEAAYVAEVKQAWPNYVAQAISSTALADAQAEFAGKKGWKTAYEVTNPGFQLFTEIEKRFPSKYPGKIVGQSTVPDTASDYAAVVSKIQASHPAPQVIVVNDYFPHVGTFIKELRAAGVTTPVLGNDTFSSPALPTVAGTAAIQNVYYATQDFFEGPTAAPVIKDFASRYKARFGAVPPNPEAVLGYEGILILADALRSAHSTSPEALNRAMLSERNLVLPGGDEIYSWTGGAANHSATIVGFDKAGQFIQVAHLNPEGL